MRTIRVSRVLGPLLTATTAAGLILVGTSGAIGTSQHVNFSARSSLSAVGSRIRQSAAGPVTDHAGATFTPLSATGGFTTRFGPAVAGAFAPELFAAERAGLSSWTATLVPGTYTVSLYEAEQFFRGPGQRVFSVAANGAVVVSNLDIYARVGFNRAEVVQFPVKLVDGRLTLSFAATVNLPKVDSIDVEPAASTAAYVPPSRTPRTTVAPTTVTTSTGAPATLPPATAAPTTVPPTTAPPTTVSPTTVPPTTGAPGHQIFSASSLWNSPVGPTGAAAGIPSGWINQSLWTVSVYHGNASTPLVSVPVPAGWGWPAATLQLPIPAGAHPTSDGDAEMVVINDSTGDVTDLYGVKVSGTSYTAADYSLSNVTTSTGFGAASPFRAAGVRAIGCSTLGGLILGSDVASGTINHGLAVALPYALLASRWVAPAIASDAGGAPGTLAEGERLAIPASTPKPASLSPLGSITWDALVRYGAIIVDQVGGNAATLYMDNVSTTAAQASQLQADATTLVASLHVAS